MRPSSLAKSQKKLSKSKAVTGVGRPLSGGGRTGSTRKERSSSRSAGAGNTKVSTRSTKKSSSVISREQEDITLNAQIFKTAFQFLQSKGLAKLVLATVPVNAYRIILPVEFWDENLDVIGFLPQRK